MSEVESGGPRPEEIEEAQKFDEIVDEGKLTPAEMAEVEKEKTPEEVESEKKATEKLKVLMNPDFRNFGIRFVTAEEYRATMADKKLLPREVFVFRKGHRFTDSHPYHSFDFVEPNFQEFNKVLVEHPQSVPMSLTDWDHNIFDIKNAKEFLWCLRTAYAKAKKETADDPRPIREKTMAECRKGVLEWWERSYSNRISNLLEAFKVVKKVEEMEQEIILLEKDERTKDEGSYQHYQKKYLLNYIQGIKPNIDKYKAIIGEENWEIFNQFYFNENWLNEDPKNVRKLFNAASYGLEKTQNKEKRQYHIALVYDLPALTEVQYTGARPWATVKKKNVGERLLGAVSLMPNQELSREMISASSKAQEFAHPVFDSRGYVRYPKTKESAKDKIE